MSICCVAAQKRARTAWLCVRVGHSITAATSKTTQAKAAARKERSCHGLISSDLFCASLQRAPAGSLVSCCVPLSLIMSAPGWETREQGADHEGRQGPLTACTVLCAHQSTSTGFFPNVFSLPSPSMVHHSSLFSIVQAGWPRVQFVTPFCQPQKARPRNESTPRL